MAANPRYTLIYASIAEAQVEAALLWWQLNRDKAPDRLARELDQALEQIALVPKAGKRARLRDHDGVRRLLLRVSAYDLYYSVDDAAHEIKVVYFHAGLTRQARRGRFPRAVLQRRLRE